MFKRAHLVPSQPMGRKIYLWQYGDFGAPVLVFPSAAGMAHEWENHGMVDALADLVNHGKIKLYCVESNVSEAWTKKELDPAFRIQRHMAYERFVIDELVPFVREDCRKPDIRIAAAGCSLGAFYSANLALKHPEIFHYALCMSGRYDITEFAGGLQSIDLYFNNPMAYVGNLSGEHLERVRRGTHLALVCGQGKWEDGNWQETIQFSKLLGAKGISNHLDLWGHDAHHQWDWWQKQARLHLARTFP
jgi:esterase/lipase superfamily enzyme